MDRGVFSSDVLSRRKDVFKTSYQITSNSDTIILKHREAFVNPKHVPREVMESPLTRVTIFKIPSKEHLAIAVKGYEDLTRNESKVQHKSH